MARRNCPGSRPGIRGVDRRVREPVECHRCRPCRNHRNDNPRDLVNRRDAIGGKHRPAERKREREYRVLPLDHFKGDAQILEDRHTSIVN